MNHVLKLAIALSSRKSADYRAMAARIRGIQIVDDDSLAEAVVTDNPAAAVEFAAAGRSVLLADPLTLPDETVDSLDGSARVMPGLLARFRPSIQPVKQALQSGKLGTPGLLRVHRWQSESPPDQLAVELDLALWMFEAYPSEIYAVERQGFLQVHLGFPGGGMALLDIDHCLPAHASYDALSIIGSSGAAYADDHRNVHLRFDSQGVTALKSNEGELAIAAMLDQFVQSLAGEHERTELWQSVRSAIHAARQVRMSLTQQRVLVGGADV